MGYQINGIEIDDCIELSNKKNLEYTLLGMAIVFFVGILIAMIIINGD